MTKLLFVDGNKMDNDVDTIQSFVLLLVLMKWMRFMLLMINLQEDGVIFLEEIIVVA